MFGARGGGAADCAIVFAEPSATFLASVCSLF
jgi:hypothetical protein